MSIFSPIDSKYDLSVFNADAWKAVKEYITQQYVDDNFANLFSTNIFRGFNYFNNGLNWTGGVLQTDGSIVLTDASGNSVTINKPKFDNIDASLNDLDTGKASVQYVNDSINALVDGSPEALNTLKEISESLNNNPSFANTIINMLALKLDKTIFDASYNEIKTITTTLQETDAALLTQINTKVSTTDFNTFKSQNMDTIEALYEFKADKHNPVFTGEIKGVTKEMVGLSNVDNISAINMPISNAVRDALNLKATIATTSVLDLRLNNIETSFINDLAVGTIASLPPETAPSLSLVKSNNQYTLNIGIPEGRKGTDALGFTFQGEYSDVIMYSLNDVVKYNGSAYVCISTIDIEGINPSDDIHWDIIVEKGEKGDKGDTGEQGPKGSDGDKGEKGDQGEKGDKGEAAVIDMIGLVSDVGLALATTAAFVALEAQIVTLQAKTIYLTAGVGSSNFAGTVNVSSGIIGNEISLDAIDGTLSSKNVYIKSEARLNHAVIEEYVVVHGNATFNENVTMKNDIKTGDGQFVENIIVTNNSAIKIKGITSIDEDGNDVTGDITVLDGAGLITCKNVNCEENINTNQIISETITSNTTLISNNQFTSSGTSSFNGEVEINNHLFCRETADLSSLNVLGDLTCNTYKSVKNISNKQSVLDSNDGVINISGSSLVFETNASSFGGDGKIIFMTPPELDINAVLEENSQQFATTKLLQQKIQGLNATISQLQQELNSIKNGNNQFIELSDIYPTLGLENF